MTALPEQRPGARARLDAYASRGIAVALVAKSPEPGRVKTRFCPACTPEEAAAFARAFLTDTAAIVTSDAFADVDAWCSYSGDATVLRSILPESIPMLPQRGGGFDARLSNAADDLFARGYGTVLLLGADCPTVDGRHLRAAVESLHESDVVVGPAADGGYVLLGLHRSDPSLFLGVEMGTDRVLAQTLQRASQAAYSVTVLDVRHDLDTVSDLLLASRDGQLAGAPATSALLAASSWGAARLA